MKDYDPNYKQVTVNAVVGGKAVVFDKTGSILILRRSDKCTRAGGWDFPGGGLDYGEDPLQGVIREIEEEASLQVTDLKPIDVISSISTSNEFIVTIGYKAVATSNTVQLSWEHDQFKWVSKEEALNLELPPMHRRFLKYALE